jgi:hypothetical protein
MSIGIVMKDKVSSAVTLSGDLFKITYFKLDAVLYKDLYKTGKQLKD